jgi:endonuclease/exonuclease/phosphatase family metal-dependent hydrolase
LVARIDVLQPIGPVVFVNHATAFQLTREVDRERQAVAVAEYLERKIVMRPSLVIVAGDLNSHPDASSIRYVTSSRRVSIAS